MVLVPLLQSISFLLILRVKWMTLNLLHIIFPSKYLTNCIAVVRGLKNECESGKTFGRIMLCIPPGHCFVDLALFEDDQIAMLRNKMNDICEGLGDARMMIL